MQRAARSCVARRIPAFLNVSLRSMSTQATSSAHRLLISSRASSQTLARLFNFMTPICLLCTHNSSNKRVAQAIASNTNNKSCAKITEAPPHRTTAHTRVVSSCLSFKESSCQSALRSVLRYHLHLNSRLTRRTTSVTSSAYSIPHESASPKCERRERLAASQQAPNQVHASSGG